MYLGPIALAYYSFKEKEAFIQTCHNRSCKNWHSRFLNGDFCNKCGNKLESVSIGEKMTIIARQPATSDLAQHSLKKNIHHYIVWGHAASEFEDLLGFDMYLEDSETSLLEFPNLINAEPALEIMRAKYHQLFLDAGYDSVKYVFGFLADD